MCRAVASGGVEGALAPQFIGLKVNPALTLYLEHFKVKMKITQYLKTQESILSFLSIIHTKGHLMPT